MDSFSFNLFEQNKNSIQRRLNINGQSLNIQLNTQGINLMNINDFDFLEWNSKLQSGEITFDEFLEKLNELNISYQIITSHTNSNRINIQYTNNGNMYRFNVDKNIVNYLIPHQDASETDVIGSEESAEPAVRGVKSAQLEQNPDNTVKSDDEILAEYLENLFGKYEGTDFFDSWGGGLYALVGGNFDKENRWTFNNLIIMINSALSGVSPAANEPDYIMAQVLVSEGYITSKNPSTEEVKSALDQYFAEIASSLGKSIEDLSGADVVGSLCKKYEEYGDYMLENAKNKDYLNSLFDYPIICTQAMNGPDFGGGSLKELFIGYIYAYEPELVDDRYMKAVFKAAGISDTDSIDEKVEKIEEFLNKLAEITQMPSLPISCSSKSREILYIYLAKEGFLQQCTYDMDYFTEHKMTEEEINTYFYPETQADGTVVYKLKETEGSINEVLYKVNQRLYREDEEQKTEEARNNAYLNSVHSSYTEMRSYADACAALERFAQLHKMREVSSGVYEDENGIQYFLDWSGEADWNGGVSEGMTYRIACSDWDNAVPGYDPHAINNVHSDLDTLFLALLRNIGQPDNPVVAVNVATSGLDKNGEPVKFIYYQTADGQYHKLTMNASWTASVIDTLGYDKFCELFQASGPDTLGLCGKRKDGESYEEFSKRVKMFCIEDITEEDFKRETEALFLRDYGSQLPDATTTEPVESPSSEETEHPRTFEDAVSDLILLNFLDANISDDTILQGLDLLDDGTALTKSNWQEHDPKLSSEKRAEVIKQVLEKLLNNSLQLVLNRGSVTFQGDWIMNLIKAIGGEITSVYNEIPSRHSGMPNTISFTLDGKEYKIPLKSSISNYQLYTADKVEEIKRKMLADGFTEMDMDLIFHEALVDAGDVRSYAFLGENLFRLCNSNQQDETLSDEEKAKYDYDEIISKYFK